MKSRRGGRWLAVILAATLSASPGCAPDSQTTADLVDLVAQTSASFVQIALKSFLNSVLSGLSPIDLTAPISEQNH